jgi:N,N'-diacetyllegionaminate synthase
MPRCCEIGRRRIGPDEPLFIIAEIGLNHGGSVDRALALVDAAAKAGASAVKLQTLVAADLVTATCPAPAHVQAHSMVAFFSDFELDEAAHRAIVSRARDRGLTVMATPFSLGSVEMLERVGVDAYKIASGDITYHGLIDRCARTGRPLVLSTGMATQSEVGLAVRAAERAGGRCALLHCVAAYPVPGGSENLRAIVSLADAFDLPVGLSDHSATMASIPIAVALGASLYERHLMLDDNAIDRAVSSTPEELATIVRLAADAAAALGHGRRECLPAESDNRTPSRRSLWAKRSLPVGHVVGADDVAVLRPGTGLAPSLESRLIGVRLTRSIASGEPFLAIDLLMLGGEDARDEDATV